MHLTWKHAIDLVTESLQFTGSLVSATFSNLIKLSARLTRLDCTLLLHYLRQTAV